MIDGWYEISKGETPEKIIGSYEMSDYNTPSSVSVYPPYGKPYTKRCDHQDLHFMTKEVVCLFGNHDDDTYYIDCRRKFDSRKEWIWWKLEGCDIEYWRPLPELPNGYASRKKYASTDSEEIDLAECKEISSNSDKNLFSGK